MDADDAVSESISFISVILLFRKREKILSRLNLLNSTSYGMIVMIQEPIDVNHIGGKKKKTSKLYSIMLTSTLYLKY